MLEFLKRLIAGDELAKLNRYRYACHLVYQWMGNYPASAESAEWIRQVGEDERGADIAQFRGRIANDEAQRNGGGAVVADLRESLRRIVREIEKLDHDSCEECYGAACIANGALARSEPHHTDSLPAALDGGVGVPPVVEYMGYASVMAFNCARAVPGEPGTRCGLWCGDSIKCGSTAAAPAGGGDDLLLRDLDALIATEAKLNFAREGYDDDEATAYGIALLDFMRKRGMELRRRLASTGSASAPSAEAVDREVRRGRSFYFRHNPPSTMLAQIFNDILEVNGTFESDNEANARREHAAKQPPSAATQEGRA